MARKVWFKPDHKSFGEFILSDQVRDPVEEIAHDIAKRAGDLAPRRKSGITPPGAAMADNFHVKRDAGTIKVSGNVRVKVEVFNSMRSAAPMEFGNKHVGRGHRMLGRAGAEFGDMHSGHEVW